MQEVKGFGRENIMITMFKAFGRLSVFGLLLGCVASFAVTYEGEDVTKRFERAGKDLAGTSEFSTTIETKVYRVTTEWRMQPHWEYQCSGDTVPGNGSTGNWHGLFDLYVPDSERASRLAAAVKGIGVRTAKWLIDDGQFRTRPYSWSAFSRIVNQADKDFNTGFSYEVLVKFGKENQKNLGYMIEGENCKWVLVEKMVLVPVKQFHHSEVRQFIVKINGAPLLGLEKEIFTVSFDGFENSLSINSNYNKYDTDVSKFGDKIVYTLEGQRKRIRPSNSLSLRATYADAKVALNVADAAFDKDVNGARIVTVEVYLDKRGWRGDQLLASFEKQLDSNSATTKFDDVGVAIEPGSKLRFKYSVRYSGSQYHSGEASAALDYKIQLN